MTRRTDGSLMLAVLALSACGPPESDWAPIRDCEPDELAMIDHAVAEAVYADPFVSSLISEAYGDTVTYPAVLDRLVAVRSRGRIYCAEPADVAEECLTLGRADRDDDAILLNVSSDDWLEYTAAWDLGADYGARSLEETERQVLDSSAETFLDLRIQAHAYLMGPARIGGVLTHEAAHLEAPGCCHHTLEGTVERLDRGGDFVDDVGYWTVQGVYWRRWLPERQWLDRLYRSTR
jgi:hypothetical protein